MGRGVAGDATVVGGYINTRWTRIGREKVSLRESGRQ